MKSSLTGIVVGYGSIGRRHVRVLRSLVSTLYVVDSQESARARLGEDWPDVTAVSSLEELDALNVSWADALAIIATWGPSHANIFHALVDRGVRRVICEKPLTNSVETAETMVRRARAESVVLRVNHYLRYARLAPALKKFAERNELGQPVSVVVEGGAACLVTNGLHWIDFATELFGEKPLAVISTARGERLNPRSPDLMLYGGTAIWSFSDGREATITFNNGSSLALVTRVYFRNAVVEIVPDLSGVRVLHRDRAAIQQYPAVTRTGLAVEVLNEGPLAGVRTLDEAMHDLHVEALTGEGEICPGEHGAAAVMACIGALVSAVDRTAVYLPMGGDHRRKTWPMS